MFRKVSQVESGNANLRISIKSIFLDFFSYLWYAADDALQYHWIGRVLLRPVIKSLRRIAPLNHNLS